MLNLKQLEEKLDLALANETGASLTHWLREKRLKRFFDSLGMGSINNLPPSILDVSSNAANTNFVNQGDLPNISSQDYTLAA